MIFQNEIKTSKLKTFKFTCGIFHIAIGIVKGVLSFIVLHIVILVEHFIYTWTIFANETVLTIRDFKNLVYDTKQFENDPMPLKSVRLELIFRYHHFQEKQYWYHSEWVFIGLLSSYFTYSMWYTSRYYLSFGRPKKIEWTLWRTFWWDFNWNNVFSDSLKTMLFQERFGSFFRPWI